MGVIKAVDCHNCSAAYSLKGSDGLLICEYCGTSIVVDVHCKNIQSLINVEQVFLFRQRQYCPQSHQSYNYAGGRKVEWVIDGGDELSILTQEDEIYSLVTACHCEGLDDLQWQSLLPNTEVIHDGLKWFVTEKCLLSNDEGSDFRYTYLTAANAQLMVLIFTEAGVQCRRGHWLDPFEISYE